MSPRMSGRPSRTAASVSITVAVLAWLTRASYNWRLHDRPRIRAEKILQCKGLLRVIPPPLRPQAGRCGPFLRHPVLPCAPLSQTSRFAEAEAETPLLTALAAKGIQVDRLEDPFPLIHNARPPQSPAPAPWTPPPHHEPLRIFRPAPASTRLRGILSSALLWRGGHRPPPARTLRHIRIVRLCAIAPVPVLGR